MLLMVTFDPANHPMFANLTAVPGTVVKPGVSVIVHDGNGKIILEKRRDCGFWGLVGGRINPGENVTQTAIREAQEETGLEIDVEGLVGIYSEPLRRVVTYPNGDIVQLIDICMRARIKSGTLTKSEESLEVSFFDESSLPLEIVPPAQLPIRHFFSGLWNQIQ